MIAVKNDFGLPFLKKVTNKPLPIKKKTYPTHIISTEEGVYDHMAK